MSLMGMYFAFETKVTAATAVSSTLMDEYFIKLYYHHVFNR